MKIRSGFVSNSSSSSFICDQCGETVSGWDVYGKDCSNGHSFCEDCYDICAAAKEICKDVSKVKSLLTKAGFDEAADFDSIPKEDYEILVIEALEEGEYVPNEVCPYCKFEALLEREMVQYLKKTTKISADEVFAEVKRINPRRKKLYDNEYVVSVCSKLNTDMIKLENEIMGRFKSYDEFRDFIRSY